jgi:ABC-type branched-subunit amino acid transport system substrate-binding protein/LysM repeat protein
MEQRSLKIFITFVLIGLAVVAAGQSVQEQLKQIRSTVVDTIEGRPFYIHTIRRGQTLYMISKAYGVEVKDIINENPGVKEGIRADETLRIPIKTTVARPAKVQNPAPQTNIKPVDSVSTIAENKEIITPLLPCGIDSSTRKNSYNVALMIPLFLGDVNQLNAENPDRKSIDDARCLQFLPFYEGFRIAVDSLEQTGLKIRLYVYDVDKDTAKTRQLLKKPELKSMDLIIGLLYHRNFQIVAEFAEKNHISIVNPISERSELVKNNPYVFKIQPDKLQLDQALANYLSKVTSSARILIVRNAQNPDKHFTDGLKELCREKQLDARVVEGQQAIFNQLSGDVDNYIVTYSTSPEYIADFTRRLYELRNNYRIILVGIPDWHLINGVELEYLVALKTHAVVPGFINYEYPWVDRFVTQYQEKIKSDPEMLAFQGFDIAWYFLSALKQYGTGFGRCLNEFSGKTLLTSFRFHKQSEKSGFENRQWIITRFENYKLVPELVY